MWKKFSQVLSTILMAIMPIVLLMQGMMCWQWQPVVFLQVDRITNRFERRAFPIAVIKERVKLYGRNRNKHRTMGAFTS